MWTDQGLSLLSTSDTVLSEEDPRTRNTKTTLPTPPKISACTCKIPQPSKKPFPSPNPNLEVQAVGQRSRVQAPSCKKGTPTEISIPRTSLACALLLPQNRARIRWQDRYYHPNLYPFLSFGRTIIV